MRLWWGAAVRGEGVRQDAAAHAARRRPRRRPGRGGVQHHSRGGRRAVSAQSPFVTADPLAAPAIPRGGCVLFPSLLVSEASLHCHKSWITGTGRQRRGVGSVRAGPSRGSPGGRRGRFRRRLSGRHSRCSLSWDSKKRQPWRQDPCVPPQPSPALPPASPRPTRFCLSRTPVCPTPATPGSEPLGTPGWGSVQQGAPTGPLPTRGLAQGGVWPERETEKPRCRPGGGEGGPPAETHRAAHPGK